MKRVFASFIGFVLLTFAAQAFAQMPVYWTYNGQRIGADNTLTVPQGGILRAIRISDNALMKSFNTDWNNGYNVFVSQGHYTSSTTNPRDQVLWIGNPGGGQAAIHKMYHTNGTVHTMVIPDWFATFQLHNVNNKPGKDIVVWRSQNVTHGGNIWNGEDFLYLLGDVPGLQVAAFRLPAYQWFAGSSPNIAWAWKIAAVDVGNHKAFDVYYTGPNPNRWPATTPNGILRIDFYNNSQAWIQ